jgi:hypothetical protein
MKLLEKDNYIFITSKESVFDSFYKGFVKNHKELENKNLVVEISETLNIKSEEISLFLSFADAHNLSGTSFVLISKNVDVDDFPETFNIVPTLIEAEDIIEMEAIERELGF